MATVSILIVSVNCVILNQGYKTSHDDFLHIFQGSDGHKSTFSVKWLLNNTYEGKYARPQPNEIITWNSASVNQLQLEPIVYREVMDGESALKEIYQRVLRYGFARIEQVPTDQEDVTRRVLERICPMAHTLFGSLWETGTNFDHKDTGYLNGYLEAHTDNTYFTEAMG